MQPPENKWLASPQAIHPPAIDPQLVELGVLARSAECLRHFILNVEFWISPSGRLRWWFRMSVCLCAWMVIPVIFLMPIVGLLLHELDGCLSVLLIIVLKVILLSILISMTGLAIKHFPSSSPSSSRRRK